MISTARRSATPDEALAVTKARWSHSNTIYGLLHQATIRSRVEGAGVGFCRRILPREQQPMLNGIHRATGWPRRVSVGEREPGKAPRPARVFQRILGRSAWFLARLAHDQCAIDVRQVTWLRRRLIARFGPETAVSGVAAPPENRSEEAVHEASLGTHSIPILSNETK